MRLTAWLILVILTASAVSALAQDNVAPRAVVPPRPAAPAYELEKIGLEATIDGQKARCTLKYVIYNPGNSPIEVDFLAPLPTLGTVTGLTLFDGQKEMPGNVYDKDEAFKIYRDIVASLRDPALLEYAGRGLFRARIFPVPAKGRQNLELNFDYLVPKTDDQVGFSFPLAGPLTAGRAPEQDIQLVIKTAPGLSGIYSPEAGAVVKHEPGSDATVTLNRKGPVPDRFRLYFSTDSGPVGGVVLSHKPKADEDGFFLFMADPALAVDVKNKVAKNVVFVLDKSGSMSGAKFEQARGALRFILDRLNPEDNFNLIDYNARIYTWKPEMMDMSDENRRSAQGYVDNLRSGGGTNIQEALTTSLNMLKDPSRPNYVIFMTDGQPTVGEQDEMKLAEIAKKANSKDAARLFSFGVGFDVNARLLDRLSGQAGGSSVFVDPDENLETKVSAFFSRITTPALTRPSLKGTLPVNRVLPEELPDLFIGQQLIVVGRYPKGGETTFTLAGRQGDQEITYTYKATLADGPAPEGQFVASLWAQRRIGELIDQIDLVGGKPNQELVDELVRLSKDYGILTPYTSFLALEDQALTREDELARTATENLSIMEETAGARANAQRALKGEMRSGSLSAPSAAPRKAGGSIDWDSGGASLGVQYQKTVEMAQLDKRVAQRQKESQAGGSKLDFSLPNQWAGQTFFYKNRQWQAADLSEDDLKTPVTIKQLSDEYYALAARLSPEEMIWLTQKEPVVFKFEGTTYLVEPAEGIAAEG